MPLMFAFTMKTLGSWLFFFFFFCAEILHGYTTIKREIKKQDNKEVCL